MSAAMGFFLGTQERVRNSRGKRAISVQATEGLLYICILHSVKFVQAKTTGRPAPLVFRISLEVAFYYEGVFVF